MREDAPASWRLPVFAWFASIVLLGVLLINFLGALTLASSGAPLASLLAATDALGSRGPGLSRCLVLGDCAPGSLSEVGTADGVILALPVICLALVTAGARRFRPGTDSAASREPGSRPPTWLLALASIGVGLTLAGALGTALEAAGVWIRLAAKPNPLAEQGAPVWVPWLIAVSFVAAAWAARRQVMPDCSLRRDVGGATWCLVSAVAVWVTAVVVHLSRPEPVQGRYYGIPGFVVGRAQNYEYGTYLGMIAPAAAALCCLVLLIIATWRPRSLSAGPARNQ